MRKVLILIFIVSYQQPVKAQICLDPTTWVMQMEEALSEAWQWDKENALEEESQKFQAKLQDKIMEEMTKNTKEITARLTESMKDVFNKQVENMLKTVGASCEIEKDSNEIKEASSELSELNQQRMEGFTSRFQRYRSQSESSRTLAGDYRLTSSEIIKRGGYQENGFTIKSKKETPIRSELFFASYSTLLTENEDLLLNSYLKSIELNRDLNTMPVNPATITTSGEAARFSAHLSNLAIESLAFNSLEVVRALRVPVLDDGSDNKVSYLGLIEKYISQKWGDENNDFLMEATNSHPEKNKDPESLVANSSQMIRTLATLKAFGLYLKQMRFEQKLRVEALSAAQTQTYLQLGKL